MRPSLPVPTTSLSLICEAEHKLVRLGDLDKDLEQARRTGQRLGTEWGHQTHIILHGKAADSRCGLYLVTFDLLVGVFLSSHGRRLYHILLLDHL